MPLKTRLFIPATLVLQLLLTLATTHAAFADENAVTKNNVERYTIQVSSYREARDAEAKVAALKAHGLDAVSSLETVEGKGMWYRVSVGRYKTRQEAETAASGLEADGIISSHWIRPLKDSEVTPPPTVPGPEEEKAVELPAGAEDQARPPEPQTYPEIKDSYILPLDDGTAEPVEGGLSPAPVPENEIEETEVSPPKPAVEEPPVTVKVDSEGQKTPPADPDRPVDPRGIPEEDQTITAQSLLSSEGGNEVLIAPAGEEGGAPVQETLTKAPPHASRAGGDRFTLGLKLGGVYLPGLDEFTISDPDMDYYYEQKYITMAIAPSFHFNGSFSLEASVEKTLNSEFDLLYASLGPKWIFRHRERQGLFSLSPYIRGALSWGDMSWDDAPGTFDSGLGGEMGIGIEVIRLGSRLKLGLETSYRSMKFDYKPPSGQDVTSSQDTIDFSGPSLTGFINISF